MKNNFIRKLSKAKRKGFTTDRNCLYGYNIHTMIIDASRRFIKEADIRYVLEEMTVEDLSSFLKIFGGYLREKDVRRIIKINFELQNIEREYGDSASFTISYNYVTFDNEFAIFNVFFQVHEKDYAYYKHLLSNICICELSEKYYVNYDDTHITGPTTTRSGGMITNSQTRINMQALDLDSIGDVDYLEQLYMKDYTPYSVYNQSKYTKLYSVTLGFVKGLVSILAHEADMMYFWKYKEKTLSEADYALLRMKYETAR